MTKKAMFLLVVFACLFCVVPLFAQENRGQNSCGASETDVTFLLNTDPLNTEANKKAILEFLDKNPDAIPKLIQFFQIMNQTKGSFVDEKSMAELVDLATRGMVDNLDPYSNYVSGEAYRNFKKRMFDKNDYAGIGMMFRKLGTEIVVVKVFRNSPAEKSGIQQGDIILEVGGKKVFGLTTDQIADLIKGLSGTQVTITLRSGKFQKVTSLTITRQKIVVSSLEYQEFGDIGYIEIHEFVGETAERLKSALQALSDKKGLIIDLRNNLGGQVEAVNEMIGYFVGQNKVSVIMKGRKTKEVVLTNVPKEKFPANVVVLVNQWSASASEIMSGNLQYYKVAEIIGMRTFGKACVQSCWDWQKLEAMLCLTTSHYYLADGVYDISVNGVQPDIEVVQPSAYIDRASDKDLQFQEAMKFLKSK